MTRTITTDVHAVRPRTPDTNRTGADWPLATEWAVAFAFGVIPPTPRRQRKKPPRRAA